MKTKKWQQFLIDMGWDEPKYGWTKEKKTVKSLLHQQRQEILEESLDEAEKEGDIAKKAYSDGYNDCKKGRKKAPHDTREGYCCACDYDLACFENELEKQKQEILGEVIDLVKENRKGTFTDDGGNDCWYIDELVIDLEEINNLKQK